MPTTVKLDQLRGIRVTTATGVVRGQEFVDIYHQIVTDPQLYNATRSLADFRRASLEEITPADVRALANLPPLPRQAETRMAVVAPSAVAYGMSRMYAILHEEHLRGEVQVFQDYDEGLSWLLAGGSPA